VPTTRTVNGHALSSNVTVAPGDITEDATHRWTTDVEKTTWNGKQDALGFTAVPNTRTVNSHPLSSNVTIGPADITEDATHRWTTDTEKSTWNGKQDALGFTAVPTTRTVNGHPLSSNVTVAPGDITEDATHRWTTDTEKATWNAGVYSTVILASDVQTTGAANALNDITGLSFPVEANKIYKFTFFIRWHPDPVNTTGNGAGFALNGPSLIFLNALSQHTQASSTNLWPKTMASYDNPGMTSSSVSAGDICIIQGIIMCSSAGNVIARFASELASTAYIMAEAGSMVEYRKLN
jgi:hypothetical protein